MYTLFRKLSPYLARYKSKWIPAILFSVLLAGIKTYQASLVKPIMDRGLSPDTPFDSVVRLALLLLSVSLAQVPIRFFHYYWMRYVVDKSSCDIRESVYSHLQRVPIKYFQNEKTGELVSKLIVDCQTVAIGFHGCVDLIREPLTAIALFGLAFYCDWQLTLVIVALCPLFLIIFKKTGRKVRIHQSKVQENIGLMTHSTSEGIYGQKVAKAFNLQDFILMRFRKMQDLYFRFQMKAAKVEELASPLVEFVGAIGFSAVIVFAHTRIKSGAMTTGDFLSFATALALLMDPIRKFSRANIRINQAMAAGDRVFTLLDIPLEEDTGTQRIKTLNSKIEIKNVSFAYEDQKVLENFSLEINKGEKVALVGLSGSGKSTLINLLLRLYPVTEGEILIDGKRIDEYSLTSLRDLFGLVSQDIFLFNDTIKENLKAGGDYSDEQVKTALETAYAYDFVNELTHKEGTEIGDRGTRLSGGQGQRITIARAFLRDSDVLLFDEATSALDNESEQIVQKAMEALSESKTVVAVAHRLSTIKNYDKIVVMDRGKIVEQGKHEELLSSKGHYYKFHQMQEG